MPFEPGGLGDMLGRAFLPNTYGPGAGPPSPQGAPNPMTPPLWRPQNNLDDPLQPLPYTPPPTMPPPEQLMQRGPAPVPSAPPGQMMQPMPQAIPPVAPKLPMTPPGGGIQGMINHPFVQSILADPQKMQAAMQTPAVQGMLQDPRAMAYLQQMLQGR